ncbi:MAG TPA: hypothetical protein PLZ37_12930, partial [Nitrospira sp.]|nr:hypothetical protein [Nitrospira sp.]
NHRLFTRQTKRKDVIAIKEVLDAKRVFVSHTFLSKDECATLIRRSDALAYEPGTADNLARHSSSIETGPICR